MHVYLIDLLNLIEKGHLTPEEIVTQPMPLEHAARGDKFFDKREEACRKLILVPGIGYALRDMGGDFRPCFLSVGFSLCVSGVQIQPLPERLIRLRPTERITGG